MSNWMSRAALLALLGMSSSVFATDPVGRLGGSFAVTPSGQASYEIPVALPAGAAGMTPSLSLRYSSSTAMGLAGVGWGLSGLSAITRCSHTKVLDGAYNVDVTLTATDKLCLDGQRLLSGGAANNQTSAGWLGTATVYTTQLQGFQKITATIDTANQQPQQFTVVTKDGRTLTYGGNTNTRIVASPRYDNATFQDVPTSQVISWLLMKIQDRNGNTISYSYDVDAASSSAVLSTITYTSNATSSPALAPRHVVAFDYTTQHVMPFTYVAGSRVRNSKLLTAIRISSGDVNGQNVTEVRRYTLSYRATTSQLTKRPLLASVQQCETRGGTQQCLKPTTFTWKDAVPEFNHEITGPAWADSGTPTKWNCGGTVGLDFCSNAVQVDGTTGSWSGDPSYFSTIRYGDIDGDGKADICGRTSAGMECHLSTGNGFASAALSAPAWSNANGWNQEKYYATIQFADINGDGKADLCGRGANGLLCYPSLGAAGFDSTPATLTTDYTDAAGWGDTTKKYYYTLRFFDLDQDGISDVCGVGPSGLSCYYIHQGFVPPFGIGPVFDAATTYNQIANAPPAGMLAWSSTSLDFQRMVPVLMPMNLNRSRELALCARGLPTGSGGTSSTNGHLMCIIPTSGGASAATMFDLDMNGISGAPDWRTVRIVDINGDGWPDMCGNSATISTCVKSNGQGGLLGMNGFAGFVSAFASESSSNGAPTKRFWEEVTGYIWLNALAVDTNAPEPAANTPAWTYYHVSTAPKGLPHYSTLRYVDVNGDGLTDVCERAPDGFHCRVQRRLQSSWVCQQLVVATNGSNAQGCTGSEIYQQQNLNPIFNTSDGYQDVFAYRIDLPVAWSDWTTTSQLTNWDLPQHFQTIDMADVTGDGLPDVCGRDTTGIKCYASEKSPRDVVTTIADGYGQQTAIGYKPLTDASVYTRGTNATYPNIDLQPGAQVVSAVDVSNGVGGTNRMSYRYAGLMAHIDYGNQGFATTEVRDETSGHLTVTTFQQSFPYTGMPSLTKEYFCPTALTAVADCFLLQQTAVSRSQKNVLPAPYTGILPYTTNNTDKRWDLPSGAAVGTGGALVAASQTALSVSANPVVAGVGVQLSAQVSNGLPTPPTGTVTFVADGYGTLGSATLSSGTATFSTSFATAGTRNLRAIYSGDSASGGSTSGVTSLVVNPATPSIVLVVTPSSAAPGQTVALTATVSGSSPTGTVTFKDGATVLGTGTLNGSGVATFSTSWAVDGAHSLKASYAGDANNAALESSVVSLTVGTITPTVTLAVSMSPATFGTSTTLTATVTGYSPTGSVTFMNGAVTLGTASLNGSGVATYSTTTATLLPAGAASLTANYAGDSKNAAGSSTSQPLTVGKRTPTMTLTSDPVYVGANYAVTLKATMGNTVSGNLPTGTVTFKEGATTLGTGTLSAGVASISKTWATAGAKSLTLEYAGDSNYNTATATPTYTVVGAVPTVALAASPSSGILASSSVTLTATVSGGSSPTGTVTFRDATAVLGTISLSGTTAALPARKFDAGTRSLTATYNGNASNGARTSSVLSPVVAKASPTLSLAASPNPGTVGQNVTLTATLASASQAPGGSIVFKDGASTIGTVAITGTSAVLQIPFTTVGSHSLTATYAGDTSNNSASSSAVALTVNQRTPSIGLAASASEVLTGAGVTLTATVTGYNPTGTVTFKDGTTTLGTGTVNGSGVATFSASFASTGSKSLTAVYAGDTNNVTVTSSAVAVAVKSTTPTVTLTANPATVGQSFTATVSVSGSSPTGTVTVKEGATTKGSGTLASGTVNVTISAFTTAGAHTLTAYYNGDTNNMSAVSSTLPVTVNKATAGVALVMSPNPSAKSQQATATITITGYQPTGTVNLFSGNVLVGQGNIDTGVTPRTATMTPTFYATGTYALTAVFDGDANNQAATSSVVNQVVNPATTTTVSLVASPSPALAGQQVMLSAGIYAGGATPSGTVTFKQGTTTLGTASVQGSAGSWYAQLPYTFASIGTYSLTAEYAGTNGPATSSAVSLVVTKAQPSIELTASANPTVTGSNVTLSATFIGTTTPAGTVTFKDGSTALGTGTISNGVATLTTSFATEGNRNLTAVYAGDASNATATSPVLILGVARATPSLSLSLVPNPVQVGQAATFTATFANASSPTGSVVFDNGVTAPASVPINNGVASITTGIFTAISSYTVTASYAGDSANEATASAPQTFNVVQATPTLALSAGTAVVTQNVTLTATLSNGSVATGLIVFKEGSTTLGTGTVSNGVATLTTSFGALGTHNLTAEYAGDTNYAAATGNLALTVNQATPTVTLTASPDPVVIAQNVTLTATLSNGVSPSGTVIFRDGATTLGSSTISGGVATLTTSFSAAGSKNLTAEYSGDVVNVSMTSATVSLTVSKIQPQISWSFSPASPSTTDTIFLTITVTGMNPAGSVDFYWGTKENPTHFCYDFMNGAYPLQNGSITCALSLGAFGLPAPAFTAGQNQYFVRYNGDANNQALESDLINVNISKGTPSVALSTTPSPAVTGGNVTLTATPSPYYAGNVTFKAGSTTLGTAALSFGSASLVTSFPSTGSRNITAVYDAPDMYNQATSAVVVLPVIAKTTPTISLTATPNPAATTQPVTMTATLSGAYGTPSGTVTFKDGTTTLGTGTISNGVATYTGSFSTTGTKSLTAVYGGDYYNNTVTSSAFSQVVSTKVTPTIALTVTPNPVVHGQNVTLTATLGGGFNPSGTVTFKRGGTNLGNGTVSNGVATLTTSIATAGTYSMTAAYNGDTKNNNVTSSATSLTVTAVFRAVKDWFYAWFDGEDPPANDASPSTQQEAA